jgi:hypothetical protein
MLGRDPYYSFVEPARGAAESEIRIDTHMWRVWSVECAESLSANLNLPVGPPTKIGPNFLFNATTSSPFGGTLPLGLVESPASVASAHGPRRKIKAKWNDMTTNNALTLARMATKHLSLTYAKMALVARADFKSGLYSGFHLLVACLFDHQYWSAEQLLRTSPPRRRQLRTAIRSEKPRGWILSCKGSRTGQRPLVPRI